MTNVLRFAAPFELYGNTPIIDAKIKGKEVGLIVDSGASNSIVAQSLISELGLMDNMDSGEGTLTGMGGNASITGSLVTEIQIGNTTFSCPFDVGDYDNIFGHFEHAFHKNSSGLLGGDFLVGYGMVIDYSKKMLYMFA